MKPNFPEQEQLKCPRCGSANTKFCYYNNYNLSQPRHFCKNCRRYWTKGGALRNIPVGGGTRKNTKRASNPKRSSSSSSSSTASNSAVQNPPPEPDPTRMYGAAAAADQERRMLDVTGSFSSLLASNGQFGSFLDGLNPNGSGVKMAQIDEFAENLDSGHVLDTGSDRNPVMAVQSNSNSESYLGLASGDSGCWTGGNGWPDLAIYTPGSNFQ
jgi:hypothetical protein